MLTESAGEKLRQLRVQRKLSLREAAAMIDIDIGVLSKMERGERNFTKNVVKHLANLYKVNVDNLLVHFLSDKILHELQNEELGIKALKVTEQRMRSKMKNHGTK